MKLRPVAALAVVLTALLVLPAAPAAAATTVTAGVSATSVVAGGTVTISGTASGPRGRRVLLQLWTRAGWHQVGSDRTDDVRRYRMRVPSDWYDRHALRVVAPASGGASRGVSPTRRVVVKPGYAPVGDPGDWRSLGDTDARWDPCQVITWKYNANGGGYPEALEDLKGAFARIHRATGLRFSYGGTTGYVAFAGGHHGDDPSSDITVSFVASMSGATAGKGGAAYVSSGTHPPEIVNGSLALDSSEDLARGFARSGPATWGQIMVHEIGHVVGLDHAKDPRQLMYGTVGEKNHYLGAGDLAGLNWVGMRGGCIANSKR